MKSAQLFHVLFLVGLSTIVLFAQNKSSKTTGIKKQVKKEDVIENNAGKLKTTAASGDSVSFRDSDGNTLLKINDEGTAGSITIPPGSAPTTTTNKLYNIGSTLLFNGSTLGGGATSINDLSDAKYDGYSLFLGEGAGTNDDGTSNVNTAVGKIALYSNTSGYDNTANGFGALYLNTIGEGNTAIGLNALSTNTTGSANTAVGKNADVASNNLINATAIGYGATVNASNKVRLGNSAVSVIEGQVAYTYTSDSTKKENFINVDGEKLLEKYRKFRLTSWNYKGNNPVTQRHYGIMAQVFYSAFGHDAMGTIGNDTTLNGGDVTGINMVAIQALEKRTTEQEQRLKTQEKRIEELEKQNAELKKEFENINLIVSKLAGKHAKINVTYK